MAIKKAMKICLLCVRVLLSLIFFCVPYRSLNPFTPLYTPFNRFNPFAQSHKKRINRLARLTFREYQMYIPVVAPSYPPPPSSLTTSLPFFRIHSASVFLPLSLHNSRLLMRCSFSCATIGQKTDTKNSCQMPTVSLCVCGCV